MKKTGPKIEPVESPAPGARPRRQRERDWAVRLGMPLFMVRLAGWRRLRQLHFDEPARWACD